MDLEKKNLVGHNSPHEVYAKYIDEKQRRENWDELVTRNMNMHIKKFPQLEKEIRETYQMVFEKKCFHQCDQCNLVESQSKYLQTESSIVPFVLLMIHEYLVKLCFFSWRNRRWIFRTRTPCLISCQRLESQATKRTRRFLIGDSIEGWADAVKALIQSYFLKGHLRLRFDLL